MKKDPQFYAQLAHPHVREIEPYVPGRPIEEVQREFGLSRVVKLASNENFLGSSPLALEAAREALNEANRYPDASWFYLRKALSQKFGFPPEYFLCGAGAVEILYFLAICYLSPHHSAVMLWPGFAMYPVVSQMMGAPLVRVPLRDWRADLERVLQMLPPNTRLIFLDNPINPVGTIFYHEELVSFLEALPEDVLVVLDEAYVDFVDDPRYPDSLTLLREGYPLVILRTLSKNYGLAGLRLGFAITHPPIVEILQRVVPPFNVSSITQRAAIAALEDEPFRQQTIAAIQRSRKELREALLSRGLEVVPSQTNFLFVNFGVPARSLFRRLLEKGVIIRPYHDDFPTWARVSVGSPEENAAFLDALDRVLPEMRALATGGTP